MVDVPELELRVRRGGEQEVARIREEAQARDGLRVRAPGVHELLGHVVLGRARFLAQVDVEVLRHVHVRAALVVGQRRAVELGAFGVGVVGLVFGCEGSEGGGGVRRHERFFDVFLVAGELLARQSGLVLIGLVLVDVAGPGAFVGAFAIDDAGVALFLPLPSHCFARFFRWAHLDDIFPSQ